MNTIVAIAGICTEAQWRIRAGLEFSRWSTIIGADAGGRCTGGNGPWWKLL